MLRCNQPTSSYFPPFLYVTVTRSPRGRKGEMESLGKMESLAAEMLQAGRVRLALNVLAVALSH
jgi:hypothetical protein